MMRSAMSPNWIPPFLAALASGCTVSEAAEAAGIASSTAYARRSGDADFAEAWRLALEDSADVLEREARRRAMGVDEPVVHQGQFTPVWERDEHGETLMRVVGEDQAGRPVMRPVQARNADGSLRWLTVRKGSDALLALLLKGRRKSVFADRTELTGAAGGPVDIDDTTKFARLALILGEVQKRQQEAEQFGDIA